MTLGVRNYIGQVNMTDTAELAAYLRINEQPVTADQILTVTFIVQMPDDTSSTVLGTIQPDGSGFYRWTNTTETGEYLVQAQFTLGSGEVRSVMTNFTVVDPFNPPAPDETDLIVEQVQLRLEDIFDSIGGGPWLTDETMAQFDYQKIADFIPEALLDINVEMPPTNFTIDYFTMGMNNEGVITPNANMPLLVKGVLVLMIRHLARSYIEQPTLQNSQVLWEDRTQYAQKWQQQYQIEYQDYIQKLRLWKRTMYQFGSSALLVFNKAGRMGYPFSNSAARGMFRGYY
jgi:hypothetical protein